MIFFESIKSGGRGALSGMLARTNRTNRKPLPNNYKQLFPSQINRLTATGTQEKMIRAFKDITKDKDIEYGVAIDDNGYAYSYMQGEEGSVPISSDEQAKTTIHNHPNKNGNVWGGFSKSDLVSWLSNKHERRMIAVSESGNDSLFKSKNGNRRKAGVWSIEKGNHFDSKKFSKEYDKAVRKGTINVTEWDRSNIKWFQDNAKNLGFKFEYKANRGRPKKNK